MKHIKKRFQTSYPLQLNSDELKNIALPPDHDEAIAKLKQTKYRNYTEIMITQNQVVQGFRYQDRDKDVYFIGEPNPVTVYFHVAQAQLKDVYEFRSKLLTAYKNHPVDVNNGLNHTYAFFGVACVCATFLYTALEAFVNSLIGDDVLYRDKEQKQQTKDYVERMPLKDKIRDVVPQITGKEFHESFNKEYCGITRLDTLRHNIIHTKKGISIPVNPYSELYSGLLHFNFRETIGFCRDYINYYHSNLITECDCGKDY